jgi:hypothetical protein
MNARGIAALIFSWLLLVALMPVARQGWFWNDLRPSLPLVSLPAEEPTDIASSVPLAVSALALVSMCALIVELAKFEVTRTLGGVFYFTLIVYQLVLFIDGFRSYAYDWWLFLISLTGLRPLTSTVDLSQVSGVRVPWFSGIVLLAVLGAIWLRRRSATQPVLA